MSEKDNKQPQPQVIPQTSGPDLNQLLNKLSVKYNAKTMLDQECGEQLSAYINAVNQTFAAMNQKIKGLEEELAKYKPKEKNQKV